MAAWYGLSGLMFVWIGWPHATAFALVLVFGSESVRLPSSIVALSRRSVAGSLLAWCGGGDHGAHARWSRCGGARRSPEPPPPRRDRRHGHRPSVRRSAPARFCVALVMGRHVGGHLGRRFLCGCLEPAHTRPGFVVGRGFRRLPVDRVVVGPTVDLDRRFRCRDARTGRAPRSRRSTASVYAHRSRRRSGVCRWTVCLGVARGGGYRRR